MKRASVVRPVKDRVQFHGRRDIYYIIYICIHIYARARPRRGCVSRIIEARDGGNRGADRVGRCRVRRVIKLNEDDGDVCIRTDILFVADR